MRSRLDPMKKTRERWFLDRFLEILGITPDFSPEDRDPPDFIVTIGGKRIGLELTEFFFSDVVSGEQPKFQILREKAIEKAWKLFRSNDGPALKVVPVFNDIPEPLGPMHNNEIEDFANRFERAVWLNGWPDEPNKRQEFRGGRMLPELDYYSVRASKEGTNELWGRAGPTHQEVLEAHHIQSKLNSKALKHPSYSGDFCEIWLVIYTEGGLRDVPNEIGEDARNSVYDFPFDRAFWFDYFPNVEVTCLRKV
ncbi:MAG: hypothetical protein F4W93_12680 [Dehalococcoidia bacterium]|nr:hypothetical protein [Dehalococcoidia bacterium]